MNYKITFYIKYLQNSPDICISIFHNIRIMRKKRYIVEQYFGMSHLHDGAYRAGFTTILKNLWDTMCQQMAFNIRGGTKLVTTLKRRKQYAQIAKRGILKPYEDEIIGK